MKKQNKTWGVYLSINKRISKLLKEFDTYKEAREYGAMRNRIMTISERGFHMYKIKTARISEVYITA